MFGLQGLMQKTRHRSGSSQHEERGHSQAANVRFGSKADIQAFNRDVP
jgi:hypothetical protein